MDPRKKIILFLVSVLFLANAGLLQAQEYEDFQNWGENAKIYLLFLDRGYRLLGGELKSLETNEEVLHKLQNECSGIEFIVRDLSLRKKDITKESVLTELYGSYDIGGQPVKRLKEDLDGVVIFGTPRPYKLAFTGLPTIVVYNLWEDFSEIPYKLFSTGKEEDSILVGGTDYKVRERGIGWWFPSRGKILTAMLDRRLTCSPSISSAMFEDLVYKIKLIQAIKKLKESRILYFHPTVRGWPYRYLSREDYLPGGDRDRHFPEDFNETYTRELKESLGVEIVLVDPKEFYEAFRNAEFKKAEEIADMWIDEAEDMQFTTKSEVIKVAKVYLAVEELRKKYNCNAIINFFRTLTGKDETIEDRFWPGITHMEFMKRGIQAFCQDYPNLMVAQLLGYFLTGRPSMMGNYIIDTFNNVETITHCGGPINPHGDDRVPYIIKSHALSPAPPLQPGSGTGLKIFFPLNETVTIWKVHVLQKKIRVHTGTTVDGYSIYNDLDNAMPCRTKLVVKSDDMQKIQKLWNPNEYGRHQEAIFGDLRKEIKDLGTLLGYEVIELDR